MHKQCIAAFIIIISFFKAFLQLRECYDLLCKAIQWMTFLNITEQFPRSMDLFIDYLLITIILRSPPSWLICPKKLLLKHNGEVFLENSIFIMLAGCSHGTPRAKQSHLTDVPPPRDEQYRHQTLILVWHFPSFPSKVSCKKTLFKIGSYWSCLKFIEIFSLMRVPRYL